MFGKIKAINETIKLVKLANDMSNRLPGERLKVGFLLTNRSFLIPALGIVINILIYFNFPMFIPLLEYLQTNHVELTADTIIVWTTVVTFIWGLIERAFTRAKAVVTPKQAEKALAQIVGDDKLAQNLRAALNQK